MTMLVWKHVSIISNLFDNNMHHYRKYNGIFKNFGSGSCSGLKSNLRQDSIPALRLSDHLCNPQRNPHTAYIMRCLLTSRLTELRKTPEKACPRAKALGQS